MPQNVTQNQKQVGLIIALVFWIGIAWLALRTFLSDNVAHVEAWRLFSYAIALFIAVVAIGVSSYTLYQMNRDNGDALPD